MAYLNDTQIKHVFDLFDADGSGFMEASEIVLAFKALGFSGVTNEELESVLHTHGLDQVTKVDFNDFRKLCRFKMTVHNTPDEVQRAFKSFDKSSRGTIGVDEYLQIGRELGDITPANEKAAREHFAEILKEASRLPIDGPSDSALNFEQWMWIMNEAASSKRAAVDMAAYHIKSRAKIARKSPYGVKVEGGKTYMWCVCGHSKNQPFCDGSHNAVNRETGSNFAPMMYEAKQTKTVWFCGCKNTKAPPFCDGTHTTL